MKTLRIPLQLAAALAALALVACSGDIPSGRGDDTGGSGSGTFVGSGGSTAESGSGGDVAGPTGQGSGATGSGAGPGAGGAGAAPSDADVEWFDWPAQQSLSDGSWGTALTDIANHLPASYGTYYSDPDTVTFGHETSHGIHAHLRNYENTTGEKANAFYVLHDKAALVIEPGIWKSDVAAYVPQSLRDFRFDTYVTGASDWNDTPLYLYDEWNAYVNGAEVGVSRVEDGVWNEGWRDQSGNLEFVVYSLCVAMAVAEIDPDYFSTYKQFREFTKWNTERAMALFAKHQAMPEFASDSVAAYKQTLETSSDAEALRQFVRTTYGDAWAMQVLGF